MMNLSFIKEAIHNPRHQAASEERIPAALCGRRKQLLLASASFLCFFAAMCSILYLKYSEETLSSRISPQVLRFHVLANSDSDADQELKLNVKQMLIDTMYEDLDAEGAFSGVPLSKETMCAYILAHKEELERKAEEFMAEEGFPYSADLRIERTYFPTKIYGDVVFPCGTYDAVRVLLGEGAGKNWWCVLYPPLCFTDNAYAVVPDSSREELQNLLPETDFRDLMKNRRIVFGDRHEASASSQPKGGWEEGSREDAAPAQATVHVKSRLWEIITNRQ